MPGTPILTAAAMRAAEQAVFDAGMAEYALMERAAVAAAEIVWRAGGLRETLVLCGPGNNGGDGYVIARLLRDRGSPVRVAAVGEPRTPSAVQARANWGAAVESIETARPAALLVDALFGTGLARGLDGDLAARLTRLVRAAGHSFTIDLPSGVHTDSGECLSDVPRFNLCIALGALKPAHLLEPAASRFSRLVCADIGLDLTGASTRTLAPPRLAAPGRDAHKYSRGLVAILGGAMPGAAALAASAAALGGAGYVKLVRSCADDRIPRAVVALDSGSERDVAEAFADDRIAAALAGPGLGRDAEARGRLGAVLQDGRPVVLDADALIHLADIGLSVLPRQAILTPHEGEFQALFGSLGGNRIDRALAAARRAGAVIVLKGASTVVAAPGGEARVALPASSWLSTAGTGDVLAGLCAARLAVTGDAFLAACEAVWLQGEAARRAGPAFVADRLLDHVAPAIAFRL